MGCSHSNGSVTGSVINEGTGLEIQNEIKTQIEDQITSDSVNSNKPIQIEIILDSKSKHNIKEKLLFLCHDLVDTISLKNRVTKSSKTNQSSRRHFFKLRKTKKNSKQIQININITYNTKDLPIYNSQIENDFDSKPKENNTNTTQLGDMETAHSSHKSVNSYLSIINLAPPAPSLESGCNQIENYIFERPTTDSSNNETKYQSTKVTDIQNTSKNDETLINIEISSRISSISNDSIIKVEKWLSDSCSYYKNAQTPSIPDEHIQSSNHSSHIIFPSSKTSSLTDTNNNNNNLDLLNDAIQQYSIRPGNNFEYDLYLQTVFDMENNIMDNPPPSPSKSSIYNSPITHQNIIATSKLISENLTEDFTQKMKHSQLLNHQESTPKIKYRSEKSNKNHQDLIPIVQLGPELDSELTLHRHYHEHHHYFHYQ